MKQDDADVRADLARRRAAILARQKPMQEARWYHYALGGLIGLALIEAVRWIWG